jgi:hypothetical protein
MMRKLREAVKLPRPSFMVRHRLYFEDVLRALAMAGGAAFLAALTVATFGLATNVLEPFYGTTLRFLAAVLLVTAPYAELLEVRKHRLRRLSTAERLGFVARNAEGH